MKLYQKILLIGIGIGAILRGSFIYKNRKIGCENQFQSSAYHYLVNEFKDRGLHNIQSPLFDFNDPTIKEVYNKLKNRVKPEVSARDIQSNYDIENAVEKHLEKYGNRALIIIFGAAYHIWGATNILEDKFNAEYISITPKKLDLEDIMDDEICFSNEAPSERIEKAKKSIEIQLTRCLGVVKHMGYKDSEDYMKDISDFDCAKNIVVGIEETGFHWEYDNQASKPIYEILTTFIERFKPKSILYIGEDLFSESMKRNFEEGLKTEFMGEPQYRELFLTKAKKLKIPVEFASFGG